MLFEPRPLPPEALARAEILLVVPPFARLDFPVIGPHLLAALAAQAGHSVAVFYPGLWLAAEIGIDRYHALSAIVTPELLGERIFAHLAFDLPPLGRNTEHLQTQTFDCCDPNTAPLDYSTLMALAVHVEGWIQRIGDAIVAREYRMVGCSAVFEQGTASLSILRHIKSQAPNTITLLGGANCAAPVGQGYADVAPWVDHVFCGDSERTFVEFLANDAAAPRVVEGAPLTDLDTLPTVDYADYYRQLRLALTPEQLPDSQIQLTYESSRGCWWGQKHHCTFCGEAEMTYRQKRPERVIEELRELLGAHPSRKVFFADEIMPHAYFRTLLPRLPDELPALEIFYEEKANLTLERVQLLRAAGVCAIQPGIEALSTSLLRRMNKGVSARQNIALLRYARASFLWLAWRLLYGFPGESAADYAHYPALLPLLRHLGPPQELCRVYLYRFSPYQREPERHGIRSLRPASGYRDVFPEHADHDMLAYYFEGDYATVQDLDPELVEHTRAEVQRWNGAWADGAPPRLELEHVRGDLYHVVDTRGLSSGSTSWPLSTPVAAAALVARPLDALGPLAEAVEAARAQGLCVELDGWSVPLATASAELIAKFESTYTAGRASRSLRVLPS